MSGVWRVPIEPWGLTWWIMATDEQRDALAKAAGAAAAEEASRPFDVLTNVKLANAKPKAPGP